MQVTKNQIDDLNIQVTFNLSAEDYAAAEKKRLNDFRRRADFKGFRKGMVPMSIVQRLYGEQALAEAVNEVVSKGLNDFIKENDLRVVGEPLSSEDQPEVKWESGADFTFKFDIAQTPKLDLAISSSDKVPYYNINITETAKKEMKANMLRQFGKLEDTDKAGEDDFVIADLSSEAKTVEGAYIAVRNVSGDAKKLFVGCKPGDKFEIDVNAAFTDEADRAAMLKVKRNELAGIDPKFSVSIVNVRTFVPAEEGQEAYDQIFGEDKVHNAEEFDAAVTERLAANYKEEADYRLSKDIRSYFVEKANIALPEAFLKRWLIQINEGKFTAEQVEAEFDSFLADFRWQMIREYVMDKYGLKVEDKDIREAAEAFTAYQYAMYGMGNVPQQMIKEAAKNVLNDERQVRQMQENVENQKVVAALREQITLTPKNISVDKFRELK